MKKNVGRLDRLFRISVGFACSSVVFAADDLIIRLLFGFVALILIGTGVTGYCPFNELLGMNTAEPRKK